MKTPLHGISAELDHLESRVDEVLRLIPVSAVKKMLFQEISDSFDFLRSTIKFLVMGINRSQDFVKCSNDLALTPILETFDVSEVFQVAFKCMLSQKTGRYLKMNPLVRFVIILAEIILFVVTKY